MRSYVSKKLFTVILAIIIVINSSMIVLAASGRTYEKTFSSSKSLALVLEPLQSGTSQEITFDCNSLPSNSRVESIELLSGTGIINNGGNTLTGVIVIENAYITSPQGKQVSVAWSNKISTSEFAALAPKGVWKVKIKGKNISQPIKPSYPFYYSATGSVVYKKPQLKIKYTLR